MREIDEFLAYTVVFVIIPDAEKQSMEFVMRPCFHVLDHYIHDVLTRANPYTRAELCNQRM